MNKSTKFSSERTVRMLQEHRGAYPSLPAAVESMAPKIGCVPQTLPGWVQRYKVDTCREGVTTVACRHVRIVWSDRFVTRAIVSTDYLVITSCIAADQNFSRTA
jgi:hypothetical protein